MAPIIKCNRMDIELQKKFCMLESRLLFFLSIILTNTAKLSGVEKTLPVKLTNISPTKLCWISTLACKAFFYFHFVFKLAGLFFSVPKKFHRSKFLGTPAEEE
jgi:hypothetical protein